MNIIQPKLKQVWTTAVGYSAVIIQTPMGHLCGYVMVPEGHPAHSQTDGYLDESLRSIQCHGGLTYADFNSNPEHPYPVAQTEVNAYWIGFDCGHYGDGRDPELVRRYLADADGSVREQTVQLLSQGHIWTVAEVAAECESIATQLKEMLHLQSISPTGDQA